MYRIRQYSNARSFSDPMDREQHARSLNRLYSSSCRTCSMKCRIRQHSHPGALSNPMDREQHARRLGIIRDCGMPRGTRHRCQLDFPHASFHSGGIPFWLFDSGCWVLSMGTAMLGAAAGMYGCACAAMSVRFSSNPGAGSVSYSCALSILVSEIIICP